MIVSEVMPPPDCHDDPTTQHGAWFLSGRHPWRPALVFTSGQSRANSCTCRLDAPGTANRTAHY